MILIDDLLLFPVRGIALVARQIHDAARQEFTNEAEAIRSELREMYLMFEAGKLSEAEFESREKPLLDRLDALESRGGDLNDGGESDDS